MASNTSTSGWQRRFVVSTALALCGCTGDQLLYGLARPHEMRIGFHSAPTTIPVIGGVPIELLPLNNNSYRNATTFVVCLVGPEDSKMIHREVSLDPSETVLVSADGRRLRPRFYGEAGLCPKGDYFRAIDDAFQFKPVTAGTPARSLRRTPSAWVFSDIALRFEAPSIDPAEAFSVELHSVRIDGISHAVPAIAFTKIYGYQRSAP
jgi:hypothetical protein